MKPTLDIVIVNWNAGKYLEQCLASIRSSNLEKVELSRLVVVDNHSIDGSLELLERNEPCTLIANAENRGFAAACNQGAAAGSAEFLLFLNPDVRLLPDTLAAAVGFLVQPASGAVGIVGVQLVDDGGTVQRTCARFPRLSSMAAHLLGFDRLMPRQFTSHFLREWDHGGTKEVDQVMGAFFLVRRKVFAALQGFDERFFVYYEDLDFSLRAWTAGWTSVYLALAKAVHRGGASSSQVPARRLSYLLRSRTQYARKHFGFLATAGLLLLTLTAELVLRLFQSAVRGDSKAALAVVPAYGLFLLSICRPSRDEGRLGGWLYGSRR